MNLEISLENQILDLLESQGDEQTESERRRNGEGFNDFKTNF